MLVIYSSIKIARTNTPEDTLFLNPSSFAAPIEGATAVFLKGDYPKIRTAYERAGVPVHDYDRTPPGEIVPPPPIDAEQIKDMVRSEGIDTADDPEPEADANAEDGADETESTITED